MGEGESILLLESSVFPIGNRGGYHLELKPEEQPCATNARLPKSQKSKTAEVLGVGISLPMIC